MTNGKKKKIILLSSSGTNFCFQEGILEASEIEENNKTAVTDICASSDGSLIAVAVQR